MKVRTKLDLQEALNNELAWRRPELTSILSSVSISQGKNTQFSIRTGVLLLYAHWEGFVKRACELYLHFVRNQNLRLCDLSYNFLAVAAKQRLQQFESTNKGTHHINFLQFIQGDLLEDARFSAENVIQSKANLNSEVLKQMLTTVGVDFSSFELKSNLIDEQLLKYRNTIAHGEHLTIGVAEYKHIHQEVTGMINEIKIKIENCAAVDSFKK